MNEVQKGLDWAFRYLSRRDRTVAEVRAHLLWKETSEAVVDAVVEELGVQGYLDDARYAQRFAEDRRALDGWGSERIERKLRALGIEREHVAVALAAQGGEDELAAAVAILRRRFRVPPETDRDRERALGMLARRGYELEVAYDAVRALERTSSSPSDR